MAMDEKEVGNLIGSDKVEGTAVYGSDERKIGSIERVMIDKQSGRVSYAVLGFGGFLGVGNDHYPLPWQSLKYDTELGGYFIPARTTVLSNHYGKLDTSMLVSLVKNVRLVGVFPFPPVLYPPRI